MDQEFQEADILWPELQEDKEDSSTKSKARSTTARIRPGTSAPIPIPTKGPVSRSWTAGINYGGYGIDMSDDDQDDDGDDYNGAGTEMVPPHIWISKRNADKMPSSVCVGIGRKLKGREQRAARISVLRWTGFVEQ